MAGLLYIHGFLSSPASAKAQQVKTWCERHNIDFHCPALSAYPGEAIRALRQCVEQHANESLYLMGSSLGGYFATWLAEHYNLRAVLINPAVKPYELITAYLDQKLTNYHSPQTYVLTDQHMNELRELELDRLQYPANIWVLLQTGDETLDYRLAVERYKTCKVTVEEGGDHSFQHFERWLPEIFDFYLETGD